MKKILIFICAVMLVIGMVGIASAIPIKIGSGSTLNLSPALGFIDYSYTTITHSLDNLATGRSFIQSGHRCCLNWFRCACKYLGCWIRRLLGCWSCKFCAWKFNLGQRHFYTIRLRRWYRYSNSSPWWSFRAKCWVPHYYKRYFDKQHRPCPWHRPSPRARHHPADGHRSPWFGCLQPQAYQQKELNRPNTFYNLMNSFTKSPGLTAPGDFLSLLQPPAKKRI